MTIAWHGPSRRPPCATCVLLAVGVQLGGGRLLVWIECWGGPVAMKQTHRPVRPALKSAPVAPVIPAHRERPSRSGSNLPRVRLPVSRVKSLVALLHAVAQKHQATQTRVEELTSEQQMLRAQAEELKSCNQTLGAELEELKSGNQTLRTQLALKRQGRPLTMPGSWLCSCARR